MANLADNSHSYPLQGRSAPLGATITAGGANFSIYSRAAERIELLLFDSMNDPSPSRVISFDPVANHTYHYWHRFVPGLRAGQIYAYRCFGPYAPELGLRFNPKHVLLDPYGRGVVVPWNYSRAEACRQQSPIARSMKSVLVDPNDYNWEGDEPLHRPWSRTIIYEMHVRGLTAHPSSGVAEHKRGTYAGMIEKIPYLKHLGITAVELLPIFEFDAQDAPPGLTNYWGYSPVSFFAPHHGYSSEGGPLGPLREFRDMVKALHRAGIEVILDVVFNHTAEGGSDGPTFCFRGIDNSTYYLLADDKIEYSNFTGTGNTLNANHPVVRRMILDSLRYWVSEMHVDGFRFDLASILSRDSSGAVMSNPPVLWDIESDPALAGTKMIAEAWDSVGLYQVGSFAGDSWKEWNDHFRDNVRDFFRSELDTARRMADSLLGSPSVYGYRNREPEESINFVACHDGFTLNDLVSYSHKHNLANCEDDLDGRNENKSWNCGVEGPTDDPAIEALRNRQVKNFFAATMLSVGVPMFLMGDEIRRSQNGNNNAYCQDNETNWLDWSLISRHDDVLRFVRLLAILRGQRGIDYENRRISLREVLRDSKHSFHGIKLNEPDWSTTSHSLAISAELNEQQLRLHIILNSFWQSLTFELPELNTTNRWRRWIDTTLESPDDICEVGLAEPVATGTYVAGPRSVVVFVADA